MAILPMKAVAGPLPGGDDWVFEVKWDGMRAVVEIVGDQLRLWSANGKDATVSFPELAGLAPALGVGRAVLDGEIVALDDRGRPSFSRLQQRMHVASRRQAAERAADTPVALFLFDLLELEGQSLLTLPWDQRRQLLEHLVEPGPHWQLPAVHADGAALFAAAEANDLEGIVAKRRSSTYRPGSRTKDWVKVKIRRRQELVVGGWAPGEGGRSGRIGGLLVGYHDADASGAAERRPLRYAGRVGSGLSDSEIERLHRAFAPLEQADCPFDPEPPRNHAVGVRWVSPEIVVEVEYAEWTDDDRLRHPTYAGQRTDSIASEITRAP